MEGGSQGNVEQVESQSILGQIYRRVDTNELYADVIKADFDKSIMLDYRISKYIMGSDPTEPYQVPKWFQYTMISFKDYVVPITEELRKLMV
jgi:hypothetical protein